MHIEILVKYIHFISIFTIIGALVGEHLLLKPTMTRAEIKRISKLDGAYGVSAILLLAAGFTLWFGVGKPAAYYSSNWAFLIKLGLFVAVGLLSVYPTVFFMKNRKGEQHESISIPTNIKLFVRIQLGLLFVIPLLATMMAKGLGSF